MTDTRPPITPDMKVAELLRHYPSLEDTLVSMASPFQKLKNPVLRRTVARAATLEQAARLGKIPVPTLLGRLREAAGLCPEGEMDSVTGGERDEQPGWASPSRAAKTLDARPLLERGEHPLGQVFSDLDSMEDGSVYRLLTPFPPIPLLDRVRDRGHDVWWEEEDGLVTTLIRVGRSSR